MDKKPRRGSRAWYAALLNDPDYAKTKILELAKLAETGNQEAVEKLKDWLTRFPDMRNLIRSLDDLSTKAEQAWIARLSGINLLARMSLEEELSKLKAELLGPNPSIMDKLLVSSVIVSYLGHQRAAVAVTQTADEPHVRTAREKVLVIAQKRLQDAIRVWELHVEKKKSNLPTKPKLQLFDPAAEGGDERLG